MTKTFDCGDIWNSQIGDYTDFFIEALLLSVLGAFLLYVNIVQ